jgi:NAD(P)-dependent dehydrogenase (short-subunit alcohol dehydrogenase family)
MEEHMRLKDKVVIITGGGSGLGRESSVLFAEQGARVVVADVIADRGEQTAKIVHDRGGEAIAIRTDVRVEDDVRNVVDEAVKEYGRLDVMFANAGHVGDGSMFTPIDELTIDMWNDVMSTNTTGVFFATKHAVRAMKATGTKGVIVVTSSAASFAAYPMIPAYSASKGALNAFVRAVATDVGRYGIRINAICPTHGMSPNFMLPPEAEVVGTSYEETKPWDPSISPMPLKLDRPPSLRDNANMALFLACDESAYVTGTCMQSCDGGTLSKVAIFFEDDWVDKLTEDQARFS